MAFLVVEILNQRQLIKYAYISEKWPFLEGVPLTWREYDLLTYFFAMIIYSPNPTFVPSLSEIGDLSCITSCLVLPGFLMDTLLISYDVICVEILHFNNFARFLLFGQQIMVVDRPYHAPLACQILL